MTAAPPECLAVTVLSSATALWGTERSVLILAPHLRELGIDLTIACPEGEFASVARSSGLKTVCLELPGRGGERTGPVRGLLRDAGTVPRGAARVMRATRGAVVVHSNNLLIHADAVLAGRLARRPTVIELHDIVAPGLPTLVQSAIVGMSSAAVSISSATSSRVTRPGLRKLRLLTQAVDLDTFTPGQIEPAWRDRVPGPFVVGMVGRIDPSKGIDVLIRAAAKARPDIGVVVAGKPSLDDGGYLAESCELGARLLGPNFDYLGPIEPDDVPALLRSVDVLVNASDAEPFGLSVLEAMACGTTVIATTAGGTTDFVHDFRTGLTVAPRDVGALAAALTLLESDSALRGRLADNALALARTEHSAQLRATRLAELYRELAAGRRPRQRRRKGTS